MTIHVTDLTTNLWEKHQSLICTTQQDSTLLVHNLKLETTETDSSL